MATTEEIIQNYIERRDRIAEISKRHSEEMAPLAEAQAQIENYLMHTMNEMGVDSLKANGAGTAFKKNSVSVQMADPAAFKEFVFAPAVHGVINYLQSVGIDATQLAHGVRQSMLAMPMWDCVDFRVGKKGVQDYMANEKQSVPGVSINTVATVQIRRA